VTFGERITLEELERDPYPIYARLRDQEPVSWVPAVQLWLVTRYEDVRTVDLSPEGSASTPNTPRRSLGQSFALHRSRGVTFTTMACAWG